MATLRSTQSHHFSTLLTSMGVILYLHGSYIVKLFISIYFWNNGIPIRTSLCCCFFSSFNNIFVLIVNVLYFVKRVAWCFALNAHVHKKKQKTGNGMFTEHEELMFNAGSLVGTIKIAFMLWLRTSLCYWIRDEFATVFCGFLWKVKLVFNWTFTEVYTMTTYWLDLCVNLQQSDAQLINE